MNPLLERVKRRMGRAQAPSGLVSLDYFDPRADPRVRLHRHLLAVAEPRIPRLVYWPLQVVSYARFLRSGPPRPADKPDDGPEAATRTRLRRRHTIPPRSARRFGLDKHPDRWSYYIYDQEAGTFHAMRNRILGFGSPQDLHRQLQEIQDKAQTAARLNRLGIATPRTYRVTRAGEPIDLVALVSEVGPVFCKPQSGSRGEHAFIVSPSSSGIQLERYHPSPAEREGAKGDGAGEDNAGQAGAEYARSQFAARPYLVQQHLRSHPDLIPSAGDTDWDVATVRLITHSPQVDGNRVYSAIAEIPRHRKDSQPDTYYLSILDPGDGTVLRSLGPAETSGFPAPGTAIPHWATLLADGLTAHEQYPSIYAIAWDFAITPEGPVLLEGNTGWGIEIPQMAHGPLLRS